MVELIIFDRKLDPASFGKLRSTRSSHKLHDKLLNLLFVAKEIACKTTIGNNYLQDYFETCDFIIIAIDRQGDPRGMILTRDFADEYGSGIEIGLVCSAGPSIGEVLIRAIEQRAHDFGLQQIRLYAIDNVVGYYRKLGFVNSKICTEPFVRAVEFAATRSKPELFLKILQKSKEAIYSRSAREWTYPMSICTKKFAVRPKDVVKHVRRSKRANPYYRS